MKFLLSFLRSEPTVCRRKDEAMMKDVTRSISLVALLIFWSNGALSQQMQSEWYGEAGAGVAFQSETDVSQPGFAASTDFDAGYVVSGAIGRQYPMFRGELELLYSQSDFDSISVSGLGSAPLDGDTSTFAGMVNAYYDFDTGNMWRPFVGAGLGFANVSVDASILGIPLVDDDDSVFAYQFKAGVAYQFDPATDFLIYYRFLGTEDLDLTDAGGLALSVDGAESHSVQVAVRFRF
jgi:OOP family OmpA-OmpF porin